jgi:hypothetical protein
MLVLAMALASGVGPQAQPTGSGLTYPIVGTGQTVCYDEARPIAPPRRGQAFYGQDAQFPGPAASYRDNGDGTISDLVTGLMWQKDPGAKVTYAAAVAGAAACRLGGYTDWRLPSLKELYSLIDFSGVDVGPPGPPGAPAGGGARPFINTNYFVFHYGDPAVGDRPIDSQYVSSTVYIGTTMGGSPTVFGVNFADGRIKGYPRDAMPGGRIKTYYCLYVRGNPRYGQNDFVDNGDGTITDRATGLTWMKWDSEAIAGSGPQIVPWNNGWLDWEEALAWAAGLNFAGAQDWRLPNVKELQSIVDYTRAPSVTGTPAISPLFQCTPLSAENGERDWGFYWSSTTHADSHGPGGTEACYVCFGSALGWMNAWLDVHGAGAQRSDPKYGNPAWFPWGRGPQGDAVRIYNLVRCVRGG